MRADPVRDRMLLGRSAALWAGPDGVHVEPDRWSALSGADTVDYNIVVCSGPGSVEGGLAEIKDAGAPSLLMLADLGLGEAQVLVEASWVCIGSVPVFASPLREVVAPDPNPPGPIRRLGPEDMGAARELLVEVFAITPEHSLVALPDRVATEPGLEAWGSFEDGRLVSCFAFARVEEAMGAWSLATHPSVRGRGHASALLAAACAATAAAGVEDILFQAAPRAADLYVRLGFRRVERWQLWSRPRWVLGRA